ncbi:F-box/WD repeat-containing protein 7 isoform X3 [Rhizophagus clarus]|uniref:F-box/WD repeat-containing protein 7 isoform X3 n=1 Tax=Rhizophagus clarus TaxID=94130 RepID=A0A8H3LD22_9GLOM|nr:F-box/WD repeat-containing protein 7 isoform X3 [Rhizophagus clarus]
MIIRHWRNVKSSLISCSLLSLVEECDPHEIFTLQQILESKGFGKFDIIGALPPELAVKIFAFLNVKDLCTCREVCKTWVNITNESTIWRLKCLEFLYVNQGITVVQNLDIPKEGWKKMYQKQYRREINWNNGKVQTIKFLKGHEERVTDAKLKENILVTGSADRTVRIWNIKTRECIHTLCGNSFSCVDFLIEDKIVAASTFFRSSFIWNMETGELLRELRGHVSAVRCISLSRSYVASCAFDGSLIVWNWKTGEKITTILAEATAIQIFDNTILSHNSSNIKSFDILSGNCIFSTSFNEGQLGWNYVQNYLLSKGAEESTDEFPGRIILSLNILDTLRNYSNSLHNFDTRRGRMVCVNNQESSDILQLILLDDASRPKNIVYPEGSSRDILKKEIFRTMNIGHRHIIIGCLSGTIAILDFEEES